MRERDGTTEQQVKIQTDSCKAQGQARSSINHRLYSSQRASTLCSVCYYRSQPLKEPVSRMHLPRYLQLSSRNNSRVSMSLSFAGDTMHGLNVVGIPGLPPPLLPTNLSHTWSLIAIAGFCLTSLSQVKQALTSRFRRSKKGSN